MYEKRYHDSVGISDLYKMKDVVAITEDASGELLDKLLGKKVGPRSLSRHLNWRLLQFQVE